MCTVHQIRTDLYLHVACKYYGTFNIMKKKNCIPLKYVLFSIELYADFTDISGTNELYEIHNVVIIF